MYDERITLDGLDFNRLPYGAEFFLSKLDGWADSPDPKSEKVPRVDREGDFLTPVSYEARYVELAGHVEAPDRHSLYLTGKKLTGLLRGSGVLKVEGHGPTEWATVVRESKIRFTPITDTLAYMSVTLKAPDPRKYGEVRRFPETGTQPAGSNINIFHRGTYPAAPRFYVTKATMPDGFTAYAGGTQPFQVLRPITSGELVGVDYDTGALTVNGNRVWGKTAPPKLTTVDVGEVRLSNVVPQKSVGSGSYYIEITDTYI
jgi:hypothetical protein